MFLFVNIIGTLLCWAKRAIDPVYFAIVKFLSLPDWALPPSLLFIVAETRVIVSEWTSCVCAVFRLCCYKYTVIGLTLLCNFAGAAAEYINSSIYPI